MSQGDALTLLDLCLRGRHDPSAWQAACAMDQAAIDWPALLRAAGDGGVASLAYACLHGRGLAPAQVEAELRLAYHATLARNLALFAARKRLLACLAGAGIPVILLKGAALAEGVYGNLALRPMGDLDLLVRPEDAPAALQALDAAGYRWLHPEYCPGYALAYRNNVELMRSDGQGIQVELHWRLLSPLHYQRVLDGDWLWQTARPACVGGLAAQTLGPEAQVLYLCGHILQHGDPQAGRTIWLYDVAEVIACYGPHIDWHELLSRAQAHDLLLALRSVLEQTSLRWGAPVPAAVLERLRALRPSRREQRAYAWLTAAPGAVRFIWAEVVSLPGWRSRLRFLWCNLLPSADYMRRQYQIRHSALLPWYHLRRWARILTLIR